MSDANKVILGSSFSASVKWVAICIIMVAIVAGNYYYANYSVFYRVVLGLILLAVAGGIFYTTERGKKTVALMLQARLEIGRVIWPTRSEMMQTFISVILMVILVMLLLWGLDSIFAWAAAAILG